MSPVSVVDPLDRPRLMGVLSLVDGFSTELAALLLHEAQADAAPGPHPIDAEEVLRALESAGWLRRDRHPDRASPGGDWRWVARARRVARASFTASQPDLARRLNAVAADWYSASGAATTALRHAIAGGSWSQIVTVIETHWPQLLFDHPGTLRRALAVTTVPTGADSTVALALRELLAVRPVVATPLPPLVGDSVRIAVGRSSQARAELQANLAAMVVLRRQGQYALARRYSEQVDAIRISAMAYRSPETSDLAPILLGQSATLAQLMGEPAEAAEQLRYAYRYAPTGALEFSRADVAARLALSYAMLGLPQPGTAWLGRVIGAATHRGLLAGTVRGIALLAEVFIGTVELERSRAELALGALGPSLDADEYWPFVVRARAAHALTWGDAAVVASCLAEVRFRSDDAVIARASSAENGGIAGPLLAAVEANLLLALGRGNEARGVLTGRYERHSLLDIPRARLALLSDDNQRARDLTVTAVDRPMVLSPLQRLEMTLIHGIACNRLGRGAEAADSLRRAVHQANLQAIRQPFARLPRADLLVIAERVPEAQALLDDQRVVDSVAPPDVRLVTLSEREQLILTELARGRAAGEIAAALNVSINTVRSQRRALYRKLGVNSRSRALAAAAESGLLTVGEP